MKSVYENFFKSSLETFQKPLPFREIYVNNDARNMKHFNFVPKYVLRNLTSQKISEKQIELD